DRGVAQATTYRLAQGKILAQHEVTGPGQQAADAQQHNDKRNIGITHARFPLIMNFSDRMPAAIPATMAMNRPMRSGNGWPSQATAPATSTVTSMGRPLMSGMTTAISVNTPANSSDHSRGTRSPISTPARVLNCHAPAIAVPMDKYVHTYTVRRFWRTWRNRLTKTT